MYLFSMKRTRLGTVRDSESERESGRVGILKNVFDVSRQVDLGHLVPAAERSTAWEQ
jgi:hypothetical protein